MIHRLGRRAFLLAGAGVVGVGLGATPVRAQTPPFIIPQPPPIIIVGAGPQLPIGISTDEVDETFTGQVTGNADVDLDVDSFHEEGQATAP
jgi:hypothetical protein